MTKRTTITIQEDIEALAQEVMAARRFKDFSGFLAQLIREEHERRNGPMTLQDGAAKTPPKPGPAASYATAEQRAAAIVDIARAKAREEARRQSPPARRKKT